MECEEFILPDWSPPDNPIQSERASSSLMGCEELIFPDWSPTDNPIQSERAKRASSSIMESEEFILPDWSPPDNPIQSERASSSLMECEKFILPDWSPPNNPARVLAAEGRRNPSDDNADDDDDGQQSLCWAFQFKEPPSSPSPLNQKLAETIQKRPLHSLLHSLLQLSKAIFADAARKHTTMVKCAVSMDDH